MPPTRLAGELRAVGSQANGLPWAVALERPETGRRAVHGVIELQDLAVATSGDDRAVWPWRCTPRAHHGRAPVKNDPRSRPGSGFSNGKAASRDILYPTQRP